MASNSGQLARTVSVVTGAARGLGAAFARRHIVARGGKVVIADLLAGEGKQSAGELGPTAPPYPSRRHRPTAVVGRGAIRSRRVRDADRLGEQRGVSTEQFVEHPR